MQDLQREQKLRKQERRRLMRLEQEQEQATWPRLSRKKGDFDYSKIYKELGKYITKDELPKLKNPNRAHKNTKKNLLRQFREIANKKRQGYVFYSIRSAEGRRRFNLIFDPDGIDSKGGWIKGTLAHNGKAKLRFDKFRNPIMQLTAKTADYYIYLNGQEFLSWALDMELDADEEELEDEEIEAAAIATFLGEIKDPSAVYFAFSHLGFTVKRGGSLLSKPSIATLLLALVHDSEGLMDKITALVNHG